MEPEFTLERWGYEAPEIAKMCFRIPGARIDYEHGEYRNGTYWLLLVATDMQYRRQGRATQVLDLFFQHIVVPNPGTVCPGTYTPLGGRYLKHVIFRLAEKYKIRVVHEEYAEFADDLSEAGEF